MQKIEMVTGPGLPLLLDDIDTDRIIPARYLRCVTFDGIGKHAFEDDRQQDPNHPFDNPAYQNASVLVARRNFGCGSSREHAPQSLMRWGIKAIVAESFAEIFFGNCTSLGIPAVCAPADDLAALCAAIEADPTMEVTVDLEGLSVRFGENSFPCTILDSARNSLLSGQWDSLTQLLEDEEGIAETASRLPYVSGSWESPAPTEA